MSRTILLIEDNEENRYLATFLLERNGYIEKPINPDTFIAEIESICASAAAPVQRP